MSNKAVVMLNNGRPMPVIGIGTWQSPESEVKAAVNWALEAGYRHIDAAYNYMNEAAIGDVIQDWIKKGKLKREDLFITTKLPFIGNYPDKVEHYLKLSLQALKLDYVDLYLIHFPVAFIGKNDHDVFPMDPNGMACLHQSTDHIGLWKAMEAQVDAGRAKAIGLSNFNSKQIENIVQSARIKPANLQVELCLYFQQKQLRALCKKHGISVCAYGPLGSGGRVDMYKQLNAEMPELPIVLNDSAVLEIARAHSKTPAQVLLRHLIQQDVIVIPKSVSQKRIQENVQVFDFVLSAREIELLNGLDKNERSFLFEIFGGLMEHPDYPFRIPF